MSIHRSRGRKAFKSAGRSHTGPAPPDDGPQELDGRSPDWEAVERLLSRLASTRTVFSTANSSSNWISSYEPGRRLMLETDVHSTWVQVEHVKTCWRTFERLGRIRRRDVLEPGRHSAFMMTLFERLPGVRREQAEELYLVLSRRPPPPG